MKTTRREHRGRPRPFRGYSAVFIATAFVVVLFIAAYAPNRGAADKGLEPAYASLTKWAPTEMFSLLFPVMVSQPADSDKFAGTKTSDKSSLVQQKSPKKLKADGTEFVVSEVIYAGRGATATNCRLLGIAYSSTSSAPSGRFLRPADAKLSLDAVAKRVLGDFQAVSDSPVWVAAVELEGVWKPWKLVISTHAGAIAATPGASVPANMEKTLNNTSGALTVKEIDTARVLFPLPGTGPLELSSAMSFNNESIVIGFYPKTLAADMPLPGNNGYSSDNSQNSSDASTAIKIPHALINFIFTENYHNVPIFVGEYGGKKINVSNPVIGGKVNNAEVTALLDPRSIDPNPSGYDASKVVQPIILKAAGGDLLFESLETGKQICPEPVAATTCHLIELRAQAAAILVTLTRKDSPIRPIGGIDLGILKLDTKSLGFHAMVVKIYAGESYLTLSGHISMEVE